MTTKLTALHAFDTTNFVNWGARSASLALRQMLDVEFDVVNSISGAHGERPLPVNVRISAEKARAVLRRRGKVWARAWWKLEEWLGAEEDYIDGDPCTSARRMIQYQHEHNELTKIIKSIKEADTVVIDGDGDLVLRPHVGRYLHFLLAIVELAANFDTPVHFVNSIVSDCSLNGRNEELADKCAQTLRKCTSIALRDPESIRVLHDFAPDLQPTLIPDSLFAWYPDVNEAAQAVPARGDFILPHWSESAHRFGTLRFDQPYICVLGGSRAAWNPETSIVRYVSLVESLKSLKHEIVLIPTCRGDQFLEVVSCQTGVPLVPVRTPVLMGAGILARSRLTLTGRYHPAIMAALGGTPCVFLESNAHKLLSLQPLLGYNDSVQFSSAPTDSEIDAILARSQELLQQGEELRAQIKNAAHARYEEACRLPAFIAEATEAALSERAPVRSTTR
jgi:hypothetical protein